MYVACKVLRAVGVLGVPGWDRNEGEGWGEGEGWNPGGSDAVSAGCCPYWTLYPSGLTQEMLMGTGDFQVSLLSHLGMEQGTASVQWIAAQACQPPPARVPAPGLRFCDHASSQNKICLSCPLSSLSHPLWVFPK